MAVTDWPGIPPGKGRFILVSREDRRVVRRHARHPGRPDSGCHRLQRMRQIDAPPRARRPGLPHLRRGAIQGGGGERALPEGPAVFAPLQGEVGYVFQDSDVQLFCPTVLDESKFGPLQLGLGDKEAQDRAHAGAGDAGGKRPSRTGRRTCFRQARRRGWPWARRLP